MQRIPLKSIAIRALRMIAAGYLLLCAMLWGFQRHLIYVPITNIRPLESYGLAGFSDVALQSADGTHVTGWYHPAKKDMPTIVYFHGNGGNMGYEVYHFMVLANAGFGVMAVDYRGYGRSEGSPTEEGVYADARAAVTYVTQAQGVPLSRVIFYGHSLGTGIAVQMATEYTVAALVLQSPFTSVEDVAVHRFPWAPVHMLLRDHFDSAGKITGLHMPMLFFHGDEDKVVPEAYGKKLFALASEPKAAFYYPGRGHHDLDSDELTKKLLEFCRAHGLIRA